MRRTAWVAPRPAGRGGAPPRGGPRSEIPGQPHPGEPPPRPPARPPPSPPPRPATGPPGRSPAADAPAPGNPFWPLGSDPASGLLVRVDSAGLEAGKPRHKTVIFSDHADKDGLLVPGKWELFLGGSIIETSRLNEISFPDKVDPKEF